MSSGTATTQPGGFPQQNSAPLKRGRAQRKEKQRGLHGIYPGSYAKLCWDAAESDRRKADQGIGKCFENLVAMTFSILSNVANYLDFAASIMSFGTSRKDPK